MPKLYFGHSQQQARHLAKKVADGQLSRIRNGIFTDAKESELSQLLHHRWHEIVDFLYPDAIASHVTAVKLMPVNQTVFITAAVEKRRKIVIAGQLIIEVLPGDVAHLTEPFIPHLFRSSPTRYLLENLQSSHKDTQARKTLGVEWVEQELVELMKRHGEQELNRIRDEAKQFSQELGLTKVLKKLESLIGALLTTRTIEHLNTPQGIAMAKREPFDSHRLVIFNQLSDYLMSCDFASRPYQYDKSSWRNLSFYESYFSNYIEGTEFEITEAEQIVFERLQVNNRHEDSHDVLAVYDLVHDHVEMNVVPQSADDLLELLKMRHELIMRHRPDKRPGQLKQKVNVAGSTVFVSPDEVEGTLSQGFEIYQCLPVGMARAIFIQFLVAECHPFDDGNGRLARIMMNAELTCAQLHKMILPTVHRDSYLNGLRHASRGDKFRTLTKVCVDLQAYSATVDWSDYGEAKSTLELHMANRLPDEGVAVFNRQLATLGTRLPAG